MRDRISLAKSQNEEALTEVRNYEKKIKDEGLTKNY